MSRSSVVLFALVLSLGILVGMVIGHRSPVRAPAPVPPSAANPLFEEEADHEPAVEPAAASPSTPAKGAVAELEQELAQAMSERTQLREQLTDLLNWILTNVRGTYPLPEQFMSRLRLAAVNTDFSLDPGVAELLNITAEEEAILNDAFETTATFLEEMGTAIMRVTQPHEDKVVVHIPSFGEEGELIREDLYLALEAVLGPNRFDRFMQVSEEELENSFEKFGEASHTILFEVVYGPNDDQPYLRIRDGRVEEDETGKRYVSATEEIVAVLPDEYMKYLEWWLPEYETGTLQ